MALVLQDPRLVEKKGIVNVKGDENYVMNRVRRSMSEGMPTLMRWLGREDGEEQKEEADIIIMIIIKQISKQMDFLLCKFYKFFFFILN